MIGTYRVLTPAQARRVGSTYSDTEFDLTRLRALRERMVELGRSCVHPTHRQGGVILALWGALAELHASQRARHHDRLRQHPDARTRAWPSGDAAASIWRQLRGTHLAPIELPGAAAPAAAGRAAGRQPEVEPPALIRGYLRWAPRCWARRPGTRTSTPPTCRC